ncbi:hypothetical protein ACFW04_014245 [Cataglyphis niger]
MDKAASQFSEKKYSPAFVNLLRIGIPSHIRTLNPETLERQSATLACRRMKGKHAYVLARAINSIFLEYHIQNKVCCTTTDNGSNFVKAFRWNLTFDSILQLITLLKNDSEKINQCLDYLQRLTENKIKFMEEYCQIMKLLAQALDILQNVKDINGEEKKLVKNYLENLLGIRSIESSSNYNERLDDHHEFFIFNQIVCRFLKSNNCNINILNDYTAIKKLFIKYNTALPSNASVERMFTVDGSVMTPQRGYLHHDIIEYQIV